MDNQMSDHECKMIGKIEALIAKMDAHLLRSTEDALAIRTLINKHDEAINGNGKPGFKTRIQVLENSMVLAWGGVCTGVSALVWLGWEAIIKR